jgi:hypothetical protein
MFERLSRSWEFAKISYGIVWDFKNLIVFPILSGIAALLVLASFALPLWGTGTLQHWQQMAENESAATNVMMWVTLFLFYFCNYFVIVFFNAGLIACAMQVLRGEVPTVGYGLSVAGKRLPQIVAWALVSAVVGVLLRSIENANEKAGRFIAAILGTGWTIMTFFVVPVLVVEGVGPVQAIRGSLQTMKRTWGEALVGNFSMGFISLLITLPVLIVVGLLAVAAFNSGAMPLFWTVVALGVVLLIVLAAATSAADVIFKALLYHYATGQSTPANIDDSTLAGAFAPRT